MNLAPFSAAIHRICLIIRQILHENVKSEQLDNFDIGVVFLGLIASISILKDFFKILFSSIL